MTDVVTDEMVQAALKAFYSPEYYSETASMRAALEAAMVVMKPTRADAEIARLREAMKPFAEWHLAHIDYDDPYIKQFDSDIVGIDVGDLRRARATLEGLI